MDKTVGRLTQLRFFCVSTFGRGKFASREEPNKDSLRPLFPHPRHSIRGRKRRFEKALKRSEAIVSER